MNSSCDSMPRGRIVRRDDDGATVTPAFLDMVASPAARDLVVDPRLVEDAVREGYDVGYQAGYEQARATALEESRAQIETLRQRLASIATQLDAAATALAQREATARHQIEDDVVAAAVEIAEGLLGHELRHADARGRDAIARALALAPEAGLVVARLHPDDLAGLPEPENLFPGRDVRVVADSTLNPGDAIVDVGACRVDARLGEALERVREVLT